MDQFSTTDIPQEQKQKPWWKRVAKVYIFGLLLAIVFLAKFGS
jgi:hypothetical protein